MGCNQGRRNIYSPLPTCAKYDKLDIEIANFIQITGIDCPLLCFNDCSNPESIVIYSAGAPSCSTAHVVPSDRPFHPAGNSSFVPTVRTATAAPAAGRGRVDRGRIVRGVAAHQNACPIET